MTDVFAPPAPLPPAGERILAAVGPLFYEHGIHAVGVDAIAEAAGTTKKTLYDRFGSKDALVAAYLVRRARRWQARLTRACGDVPPGRDRVLAVFDALEPWLGSSGRGCAFVNVFAEYGGRAHPVVDIVRAEKEWMRVYFVELLVEAGFDHAAHLGAVLHLVYEGVIVELTAGGDPSAMVTARAAVDELLTARR